MSGTTPSSQESSASGSESSSVTAAAYDGNPNHTADYDTAELETTGEVNSDTTHNATNAQLVSDQVPMAVDEDCTADGIAPPLATAEGNTCRETGSDNPITHNAASSDVASKSSMDIDDDALLHATTSSVSLLSGIKPTNSFMSCKDSIGPQKDEIDHLSHESAKSNDSFSGNDDSNFDIGNLHPSQDMTEAVTKNRNSNLKDDDAYPDASVADPPHPTTLNGLLSQYDSEPEYDEVGIAENNGEKRSDSAEPSQCEEEVLHSKYVGHLFLDKALIEQSKHCHNPKNVEVNDEIAVYFDMEDRYHSGRVESICEGRVVCFVKFNDGSKRQQVILSYAIWYLPNKNEVPEENDLSESVSNAITDWKRWKEKFPETEVGINSVISFYHIWDGRWIQASIIDQHDDEEGDPLYDLKFGWNGSIHPNTDLQYLLWYRNHYDIVKSCEPKRSFSQNLFAVSVDTKRLKVTTGQVTVSSSDNDSLQHLTNNDEVYPVVPVDYNYHMNFLLMLMQTVAPEVYKDLREKTDLLPRPNQYAQLEYMDAVEVGETTECSSLSRSTTLSLSALKISKFMCYTYDTLRFLPAQPRSIIVLAQCYHPNKDPSLLSARSTGFSGNDNHHLTLQCFKNSKQRWESRTSSEVELFTVCSQDVKYPEEGAEKGRHQYVSNLDIDQDVFVNIQTSIYAMDTEKSQQGRDYTFGHVSVSISKSVLF